MPHPPRSADLPPTVCRLVPAVKFFPVRAAIPVRRRLLLQDPPSHFPEMNKFRCFTKTARTFPTAACKDRIFFVRGHNTIGGTRGVQSGGGRESWTAGADDTGKHSVFARFRPSEMSRRPPVIFDQSAAQRTFTGIFYTLRMLSFFFFN